MKKISMKPLRRQQDMELRRHLSAELADLTKADIRDHGLLYAEIRDNLWL